MLGRGSEHAKFALRRRSRANTPSTCGPLSLQFKGPALTCVTLATRQSRLALAVRLQLGLLVGRAQLVATAQVDEHSQVESAHCPDEIRCENAGPDCSRWARLLGARRQPPPAASCRRERASSRSRRTNRSISTRAGLFHSISSRPRDWPWRVGRRLWRFKSGRPRV